jgi:uncharacterized protein YjbI with pentapeptide repeats/DNA-binding transcriptional regulator YiaG
MPQSSLKQRASQLVATIQRVPRWRLSLWCVGGVLLVMAVITAFTHPGATWTNLTAEAAALVLTALAVDAIVVKQSEEREKGDLILQMGSSDNTFAREAIRKLRVRGWLSNEHGILRGADLTAANLSGADLTRANLTAADLRRANLRRANLYRANLRRTDLHAAELTGANLSRASLYETDLREADLRGVNLSAANLYGANLTGADLYRADLRGANLTQADLNGADLREAHLIGADLTKAQLRGANLSKANLTGAEPFKADLTGANLGEANLDGANLRGADLRGADLRETDLRGANLAGAALFRADLHEANLSEADLTGANLTSADLFRANLAAADLRDADLHGANLTSADVTDEQLARAKSLEGTTLPDGTKYAGEPLVRREEILMIEARAGEMAPDQEADHRLLAAGSPNAQLRVAREQASLSQKELAELAGVSATTVSRWERHGTMPHSAELRAKVAEVLGRWPWPVDETFPQ